MNKLFHLYFAIIKTHKWWLFQRWQANAIIKISINYHINNYMKQIIE
jgi:hypothetical protein